MLTVNFLKVKSLVVSKRDGDFSVLVNRKGIKKLSQEEHKGTIQKPDLNPRASFISSSGQVLVSIPTIGNKLLPGYYDNQFKLIDLENEEIKELSTHEAQKLSGSKEWREATICDIPCLLLRRPITAYIKPVS